MAFWQLIGLRGWIRSAFVRNGTGNTGSAVATDPRSLGRQITLHR
jgi:hypothetical protein